MASPTWEILRNDPYCQAVRFRDGTLMAAFYKAGKLEAGGGFPSIRVDAPCLVMIDNGKIRLADPAQHGSGVNIAIAGPSGFKYAARTLPATIKLTGLKQAP